LDLHDNAFNGSIPITLGLLQNLIQLDLSGNDLSGPIPPQEFAREFIEWRTTQSSKNIFAFNIEL
jgi:hypothetical protein